MNTMKTYLVSFCNNKDRLGHATGTGFIGQLHLDSNGQLSYSPIELDLPDCGVGKGITGLCRYDEGYVAILQTVPSTVLYLDKEFSVTHFVSLTDMKGVHSVCYDGEKIYVVVTSQDRVVAVDKNGQFSDVWSNNTLKDTIHMNSICLHNNELLVSCFGPKASMLWSSATEGKVFNTATDATVIKDLWHPHSAMSVDGEIICCDSSRQRVYSQQRGEIVSDLPGYSRGLCIQDDILLCGTSKGRLVSHSTGVVIGNKSDKGTMGGACGVSAYRKDAQGKYQLTDQLNLDTQAEEIYDIIPCIE